MHWTVFGGLMLILALIINREKILHKYSMRDDMYALSQALLKINKNPKNEIENNIYCVDIFIKFSPLDVFYGRVLDRDWDISEFYEAFRAIGAGEIVPYVKDGFRIFNGGNSKDKHYLEDMQTLDNKIGNSNFNLVKLLAEYAKNNAKQLGLE